MDKKKRKWLRVLCWAAGVIVLLPLVSFALLNTDAVQNKLKNIALKMLSEKLHTTITLDKASVKFFSHDVELHGLLIKDQSNRDMLSMKSLVADVSLWHLLAGEVKVSSVALGGVDAHLYKSETDSVINCQFLIDAFDHDKDKKSRSKFTLSVNDVDAEDVAVGYNDDKLKVAELHLDVDGKNIKWANGKDINAIYKNNKVKFAKFKIDFDGKNPKSGEVENVDVTYKNNSFKFAKLAAEFDGENLKMGDVEGVSGSYNKLKFKLNKFHVELNGKTVNNADLKNFSANWTTRNYKGDPTAHHAELSEFKMNKNGHVWDADAINLRYVSNNHLPRKNAHNPKRGFFDKGHLDITTQLKLKVDHMSLDSLHAAVTKCVMVDKVTGIDVRDLQCLVSATKRMVQVKNVKVQQGNNTRVTFAHGEIMLPSDMHRLSFRTSPITVNAFLRDISRPFAPLLKDFTIPLLVSAEMSGTDEQININNAVVHTADNQFRVNASGTVIGFQHGERHQLHVHFDVKEMLTNSVKVEEIIKQFPVKRFMMKQLHEMGAISYTGNFDVLWKKEEFRGRLTTEAGDIDFELDVDGLDKYLTGKASTSSLDAGRLLGMSKIGKVTANADFKIDISGPRAAAIRGSRGGKLPIGEATAHVDEASYRFLKVKNIDLSVKSDGVTAEGDLVAPRKFIDLSCSFSFVDTDDMSKLKIHPHLKVH